MLSHTSKRLGGMLSRSVSMLVLATAIALIPSLAFAGADTSFDWAVIGDAGNDPVPAEFDLGGVSAGRGSVPYTYRMSKLEVTTAQWVEFVNTFSTQSDDLDDFARPTYWGAAPDPTYTGPGARFVLRDGVNQPERSPVYGISWRTAAMYTNWLHNDKSSDLEALTHGAYDTSTFTTNPDGSFNDQPTRSPGAKYWIPSLDEWLKAVHYDPNRHGAGEGGWWTYPYMSDEPPVSGLPGEPGAQTSADLDIDIFEALEIPLGAYPDARTPWGLLDASGGASEHNEEIVMNGLPQGWIRATDGASVASSLESFFSDNIDGVAGGAPPDREFLHFGLRVASAVPESTVFCPYLIALSFGTTCRRRNQRVN